MNREHKPTSRGRRSLRLRSDDYAQAGAYFVSITVQERLCLFGDVIDEEMHLNEPGHMAHRVWRELPHRFPTIEMDQFVVMPNHLHGIVLIDQPPPTQPDDIRVRSPRVGTSPAGARSSVGAPLVGAQDLDLPTTERSSVGAPLVGAQDLDPPTTERFSVGAPLVGAHRPAAPGPADPLVALGDVIGAYKSLTTVEYTRSVKTRNWPPFPGRLWQRNYYEHVVRTDESLLKISEYILYNPRLWAFDLENPLPSDLASKRDRQSP